MHLLIPGGPGLHINTLERLGNLLTNAFYLDYTKPDINSEVTCEFEKIVCRGIDILSQVQEQDRFVTGHSYGGLIAKEISNRINVNHAFLINTPVSQECYDNIFLNYSKKASGITIELNDIFRGNPTDGNFANWLSSYGNLYFTEKWQTENKPFCLFEKSLSQAFQALSNYGLQNCERICKSKSKGKVVVLVGEKDQILDAAVLRNSSVKLGIDFNLVAKGSHFSVVEDPTIIIKILTKLTKGE